MIKIRASDREVALQAAMRQALERGTRTVPLSRTKTPAPPEPDRNPDPRGQGSALDVRE